MELVQVRKKSQVTISLSIRKKLGIEEGDLFEARVEGGTVIMRQVTIIDKPQIRSKSKRSSARNTA